MGGREGRRVGKAGREVDSWTTTHRRKDEIRKA
jgi:hypothetical protein